MYHADNAYYLPATTILSKRMKTHTVSNTAFRGFGGPQGMMAIERVIDAIAWSLALDPLDVRKRNLYGDGDRDMTPYGMRVTDNVLPELIEGLEKHIGLSQTAYRPSPHSTQGADFSSAASR